MRANTVKLISAAVITVLAVTGIGVIGFTVDEIDEKQGVMIDFAYYNVKWVEMDFDEGMTGKDALEEACGQEGYDVVWEGDDLCSVDGKTDLLNVKWGMYVLDDDKNWLEIEDPAGYVIDEEKIISWARAGIGSEMMPAVDQTGFSYYSYGFNGKNLQNGEKLRVITLAPSVTETVAAVGGLDYIVGTDRYSDYPNRLVEAQRNNEVSIVGGFTDPNYEKIVSVNPDLVFLDGGTGEHILMADKLRKSGISCCVLYEAVDVDDLLKNLWMCASALGMSKVGNSYIHSVSEAIDSICRIPDLSDKRVFVSLGVSDSPFTSGSNTYISSMLESLGAQNVFAEDAESWFMVSKEIVYERQPDIIIVIYDTEEITSQREYRMLLSRFNELWMETPAFKNGDVYVFSGDAASLLSRPGARLPESLELMAKILDPESFIMADPSDVIGLKYYNNSYNDPVNGYLTYVKAQGLLEWQR